MFSLYVIVSKQSINPREEIQFENKFIRTRCSFIIAIEKIGSFIAVNVLCLSSGFIILMSLVDNAGNMFTYPFLIF